MENLISSVESVIKLYDIATKHDIYTKIKDIKEYTQFIKTTQDKDVFETKLKKLINDNLLLVCDEFINDDENVKILKKRTNDRIKQIQHYISKLVLWVLQHDKDISKRVIIQGIPPAQFVLLMIKNNREFFEEIFEETLFRRTAFATFIQIFSKK